MIRSVTILCAITCTVTVGHGSTPLPDALHDRGGVSFDFATISAKKFPIKYPNVGKNLLSGEWNGTHTNEFKCIVKLPHPRGGTYRIAAWTKVWPVDKDVEVEDTAFMIRLGSMSPDFTETPNRASHMRSAYCWCGLKKRFSEWNIATKTFETLPGETHALVMLKCEKAKIAIRDAVMCEEVAQPSTDRKPPDTPIMIITEFCNYIGGTFEVSEGQPGELAFTFRRKDNETYDATKGKFSMTLPRGIEFVDASFARPKSVFITTNENGSTTTMFDPNTNFKADISAPWWTASHVLIKATGKVGKCGPGWLSYCFADSKEKFSSNSAPIDFTIVPAIAGTQPKRYGCGGWQLGAYEFPKKSSAEMLAKFHRDCGQNWIIPFAAKEYPLLTMWRHYGFSSITPQTGTWCFNGYRLGADDGLDIPEDERFVPVGKIDIRHINQFKNAVCPSAVANRTDYVKNVALKRIADHAHGVDGLWANWEPFMFEGCGCGCSRCGEEFAKFAGMEWTEISNSWPKCAFQGGVLAKKGERFRSHIHGKVIHAIDEAVRSATGTDSIGFIPGIHFGQMTSSWKSHHPMPEASPADYAADLRWINLWGPYVPWRTSHPFPNERARHVAHFVCARDIRDQIAKDYPSAAKRPRILAAPQGTNADYFTQPEAFEMAFDAYFFNGFGGCCPWVFPMGADARYWRAFANASRRSAMFEDFVAQGQAADEQVAVEAVPEYAAPVERVMKYVEKWRKVSHLLTASYDFDGVRIVAVFNCWQKGEAFFTLNATGLASGEYIICSHDGVLWSKSRSSPTFTAEELAHGVFLSVGACRTRVFEIVQKGKTPRAKPTSIMTEGRLRAAYAERRTALAAAAKQDAQDAIDDIYGISWCD